MADANREAEGFAEDIHSGDLQLDCLINLIQLAATYKRYMTGEYEKGKHFASRRTLPDGKSVCQWFPEVPKVQFSDYPTTRRAVKCSAW
jgi:hypothetical protein